MNLDRAQMEERLDREIKEEKAAAAAGIPWVKMEDQTSEVESSENATLAGSDAIDAEETTGALFNKKRAFIFYSK